MRAPLPLLVASVLAQDTTTTYSECSDLASGSVPNAFTIKDIQSSYTSEASSLCKLDTTTSVYPSDKAGMHVSVTGVVTAVGTQKDSYESAYYYLQMPGEVEWGGVEVFAESHTHDVGDALTITGVVRENFGVTEVVECSFEKTGTADVPTPIEVSTDDFQGCTLAAEKYEGMLLKFNSVTVQPCVNDLTDQLVGAGSKGGYYCQGNLENRAFGEVFDKYKQMWVKTDGATGWSMEVDNHAIELCNSYVCASGPTTYASWTSLTCVMTYAYGTWDCIPRDEFDVVGGTAKTPASVGAIQTSITSILQSTVKYGNSDTHTGPYTVPPHVMGTGEANSEGVTGYGGYENPAGVTPAWTAGSCPPYEVLDWLDDEGNKTQNLCSCYPPNYYDPDYGDNGGGTAYVTVVGIIQGIDSPTGPFYICDESCPSSGGCMFNYRWGSVELAAGDKVSLTAKVYAYYGLNQFSYTLDITVLEAGKGACSPTVLDDVTPFTYESGCNAEAEQLEGTEITLECLKVVRLGSDIDGDGVEFESDHDNTYHLQAHSCKNGGSSHYHCVITVEDVYGNRMLVDDGTFGDGTMCLFFGECTGYTGKFIAVGDTFESMTGFVDQRRGSHMSNAEYGGYYGFMPHSAAGFVGWSSDGWSDACKAKFSPPPSTPPPPSPATPPPSSDDLSTGALIGIIVGAVSGVAIVAIVAVVCVAKGKKASVTPTATAKPVATATVSATSQ